MLVTSWSFLREHKNSWAGQSPAATTADTLTLEEAHSWNLCPRVLWSPAQTNDQCSFSLKLLKRARHLLGMERSGFAINKSQTLFSLFF